MKKLIICLTLLMHTMQPFCHIILTGAPGAGKGTCAQFLMAHMPEVIHISVGDLLRKEVSLQTPLGKRIEADVKKGTLIPLTITIELLRNTIKQILHNKQQFILDGFPRTHHDLEALKKLLHELGIEHTIQCLQIHADPKACVERICIRLVCNSCEKIYSELQNTREGDRCKKCHGTLVRRLNDEKIVAEKRLRNYHETIAPIESLMQQKMPTHEITNDDSLDAYLNNLITIQEKL